MSQHGQHQHILEDFDEDCCFLLHCVSTRECFLLHMIRISQAARLQSQHCDSEAYLPLIVGPFEVMGESILRFSMVLERDCEGEDVLGFFVESLEANARTGFLDDVEDEEKVFFARDL